MTARENQTLQQFIQEYRRDKAEDRQWKDEFLDWRNKVVSPLIQKDADNQIVSAWFQGQGGRALKFLGAILTILLIVNAIFNGFFHSLFISLFDVKK